MTLKVTEDKSAVTSVAFNPRNPELVATADAQGYVKIWRLSTDLSEVGARELELLNRLANQPRAGAVGRDPNEGLGAEDAAEEGYEDAYEEDD